MKAVLHALLRHECRTPVLLDMHGTDIPLRTLHIVRHRPFYIHAAAKHAALPAHNRTAGILWHAEEQEARAYEGYTHIKVNADPSQVSICSSALHIYHTPAHAQVRFAIYAELMIDAA